MYKFIVRDKNSGVLISLAEVIDRLRLEDIATWRLRGIAQNGKANPFGLALESCEGASRATVAGFQVSDNDVRAFLSSDSQVIDGEIEAWSPLKPECCVVRLDCEDTPQLEITSELPDLAIKLELAGFIQA